MHLFWLHNLIFDVIKPQSRTMKFLTFNKKKFKGFFVKIFNAYARVQGGKKFGLCAKKNLK